MPTLRRLLVAIDGFEQEHLALTLGLALSRRYGSELIICNVVDHAAVIAAASTPDAVAPSVALVLDEYDAAAKALLAQAAARASAAGAQATTKLLDGRPAAAIVQFAKQNAVDAIVMGTQAKGGLERAFLGSTAEGVLHVTDVPTFLAHISVPGAATSSAISDTMAFERVLVALDDSDPADAALAVALDLTGDSRSVLLACTVIETDDLYRKAIAYGYDPGPLLEEMQTVAGELLAKKLAGAVSERGSRVESIVAEGKPAEAIVRTAAESRVDLIAIGTHGRRGLKRLFLGSVADGVVRAGTGAVVVVRVAEAGAAARIAEKTR